MSFSIEHYILELKQPTKAQEVTVFRKCCFAFVYYLYFTVPNPSSIQIELTLGE